MKEMDTLLQTVVEGLKSMSQAVETLAEKVEGFGKSVPRKKATAPSKRKSPAAAAQKTSRRTPKKASPRANKPATAAETILGLVNRSKKGVDTGTLMAKTGYDRKKVANIIYKLKRQGKIGTAGKGVYVKA